MISEIIISNSILVLSVVSAAALGRGHQENAPLEMSYAWGYFLGTFHILYGILAMESSLILARESEFAVQAVAVLLGIGVLFRLRWFFVLLVAHMAGSATFSFAAGDRTAAAVFFVAAAMSVFYLADRWREMRREACSDLTF